MSDYISKSKLIETFTKYKFGAIGNDEERDYTKEMVLVLVNGQPTIDETEIIRKAFERVVERLEENAIGGVMSPRFIPIEKAIEIVKEECGINE